MKKVLSLFSLRRFRLYLSTKKHDKLCRPALLALQKIGDQIAVNPQLIGKKILWLGTSIPAGEDSYPQIVSTAIGAHINNQALSCSMIRVAHSDGTIDGIPWTVFNRSLMKTISESRWIIANYNNTTGRSIGTPPSNWTWLLHSTYILKSVSLASVLGVAGDINPPKDMNAQYTDGRTYASDIIAASYEHRVLPFLQKVQINSIGQTVGAGYNNGILLALSRI